MKVAMLCDNLYKNLKEANFNYLASFLYTQASIFIKQLGG